MTEMDRPGGPLPFSESSFHHYSKDATASVGAMWRNAADDLLVGLLGQSFGAYPPEEWILSGARAELQRRQIESTDKLAELQGQEIEATSDLVKVQRTLLESIEKFNAESGRQADKMIRLTEWIIGLTIVLGIVAALQLVAMLKH